MRTPFLLQKPSAVLPILMSVLALVVVVAHLVTYGTAREADEGTAAHLFQILIAAQVPLIIFFLFKWLPPRPKQALATLALQTGMALLAMAPVFYFNL
jgi:hypothetical protein